ncbi:hypothetical protein T01_1501 [Trichinella spiralis]|uniref:Uncharacterized protein n=1 Tax=Trichinella spiralis TaxID=6334 RepID=A0A0V1BH13_TRISP|nr:hypothetical protein T01_1501 [Trichinella spiralis]
MVKTLDRTRDKYKSVLSAFVCNRVLLPDAVYKRSFQKIFKYVEEKFQMYYKNAINHLTSLIRSSSSMTKSKQTWREKVDLLNSIKLCLINIEWGKVETKLNQIGLSLFVPVLFYLFDLSFLPKINRTCDWKTNAKNYLFYFFGNINFDFISSRELANSFANIFNSLRAILVASSVLNKQISTEIFSYYIKKKQ